LHFLGTGLARVPAPPLNLYEDHGQLESLLQRPISIHID